MRGGPGAGRGQQDFHEVRPGLPQAGHSQAGASGKAERRPQQSTQMFPKGVEACGESSAAAADGRE